MQGPLPFWHLVEESFSEAEFLWTRMEQALDAHDYTLAEVQTWIGDRLEGALEGVLLGGAAAIEPLLVPGMSDAWPGPVAVSAYTLLRLSTPEALRALEAGLCALPPEHAAAVARGLACAERASTLHALWSRLDGARAVVRAVLLRGLTACGQAPEADWSQLLEDPAPCLREAAASALRFAPVAQRHALLDRARGSADAFVCSRAILAGVANGDSHSFRHLLLRLQTREPAAGALLPCAALLGAHAEVFDALSLPALRRDALWALGFVGTREAAEACLGWLHDDEHAAVAAESLCTITGLDLVREKLVVTTEADDTPVAWLDAAGIARWWQARQSQFLPGQRYLHGEPLTLARTLDALTFASTRRRHGLAFALAARSGGAAVVETTAFPYQQQRQIAAVRALPVEVWRDGSRALGVSPLPGSPQAAD